MSEFKVGDIVAFDRDYKIRNPGAVDGHWTVEDVVDPVWSSYSMVQLSQEGRCEYMSWTYDLVLVPSERSRMIFPFEEPPAYEPPSYMELLQDLMSTPPASSADFIRAYEKPFTDEYQRRLGVQSAGWAQVFQLAAETLTVEGYRPRVVHRASSGLRQPVAWTPSDFGWCAQ